MNVILHVRKIYYIFKNTNLKILNKRRTFSTFFFTYNIDRYCKTYVILFIQLSFETFKQKQILIKKKYFKYKLNNFRIIENRYKSNMK